MQWDRLEGLLPGITSFIDLLTQNPQAQWINLLDGLPIQLDTGGG